MATFRRQERLKSRKQIKALFTQGDAHSFGLIRIFLLPHPNTKAVSHQVLVSVPKKNIKLAVRRNKIKRRIKEIYRCHKELIAHTTSASSLPFYTIGICYTGNFEKGTFQYLKEKVIHSLTYIASQVQK